MYCEQRQKELPILITELAVMRNSLVKCVSFVRRVAGCFILKICEVCVSSWFNDLTGSVLQLVDVTDSLRLAAVTTYVCSRTVSTYECMQSNFCCTSNFNLSLHVGCVKNAAHVHTYVSYEWSKFCEICHDNFFRKLFCYRTTSEQYRNVRAVAPFNT